MRGSLSRIGTISGLTVRCFPNDRRPDSWCPVYVAKRVSVANAGVRGGLAAAQVSGPAYRLPAASVNTWWPLRSSRGHGDSCGPWPDACPGPLLLQARAPRSAMIMVGVRPAGPTGHPYWTGAVLPQTLPDTAALAVRSAVQVPDPRTDCRVRCRQAAIVATGIGRRVGGR